jgi:endonuclease-3
MNRVEVAYKLLEEIRDLFPDAETELANWETPFQFLVCIMLSAQTTDKQVNKVTDKLFHMYPEAKDLKEASLEEVMDTVGSINYYRNKSKFIIDTAKIVDEEYGGTPPRVLDLLIKLPGVGYKTANVYLNDLYQENQGIAVDTHVKRVAQMYGLTSHNDPDKVAKDLEELFDKEDWYLINSLFVLYGRYILKAKNPDMDRVVLKEFLV